MWGYSYNGPWKDAGLPDEEYGEGFSALPESLEVVGNTVFEHVDNCAYEGDLGGRKTALQIKFMDPIEFTCVDGNRIQLLTETVAPSGVRSLSSYMWAAAMGLVGAMLVLVL